MAEKFAKGTNPANYNETPSTRVDGEPSALEVDQKGNLRITAETLLAGEDIENDVQKVEQRYNYHYIEALGDYDAIKSGAGFLHSISIYPGSSDSYIVIRDSLNADIGTVIAVLNGAAHENYVIDVSLSTGLSIQSAGTSTCKVCVSFR